MPLALRLGANPPFQRVEETIGACKKARLFAIVRVFLLRCSKLTVSEVQKLVKLGAPNTHTVPLNAQG